MIRRADIKKIATHYGLESQLKMLAEECSELTQAALKKNRLITPLKGQRVHCENAKFVTDENLAEEIADVEIMIEQIKFLMPVIKKRISELTDYKIDRQIRRMEEEP